MIRFPSAGFLRRVVLSLVAVATVVLPLPVGANGGDLPPEIITQGFVAQEKAGVRLLLRVPLVLLSTFPLPKRGPGYLDLEHIDQELRRAAEATSRQFEILADDVPLEPTVRGYRISLPSDRAFASYDEALARFDAPPLPASVDLFWNQGYFDVKLEMPLRSADLRLWVRANFTSELAQRLRIRLTYLRAGAPDRAVEFPGTADWIPLEPRAHEAGWYSFKGGFVDAWALDRLVFLLCLIAPFVQWRSLAALVGVLTAMQAVTLIGAALGLAGDLRWLPGFAETGTALAILLLAVGNLAAPRFRVRWLLGALIGALWGFGIGGRLAELAPFVGDHAWVSIVAFNLGVALGEFAMFGIAWLALRWAYRILVGPAVGIVLVSMVLGHAAWHWMIDGLRLLAPIAAAVPLASIAMVSIWMLPALVAGLFALYLPPRYGGAPLPSLLTALVARNGGEPRG